MGLTKSIFALTIVILGATSSLNAKNPSGEIDEIDRDTVDRTGQIASEADLNSYLSTNHISDTPLERLSPVAQRRFLDRLKFSKAGIAGFYYGDLVRELNAEEAFKILSLIGMHEQTSLMEGLRIDTALDALIMKSGPELASGDRAAFLIGYECAAPATCHSADQYACTWNC